MHSCVAYFLAAIAPVVLAQAPIACSPLHVVFARATTEPPTQIGDGSAAAFEAAANRGWSKGYGAAGFSIFQNITKLIPGTTGYPVHYPASFDMQNSAGKGVTDMLEHLTSQSKACPEQKFVLGGHSQGGGVTVGAIPKIDPSILSKIVAVAMVGSPPCPAQVAGRCKSFCNAGDNICEGGGAKGGAGAKGSKGMGGTGPKMGGAKGMGGMGASPAGPPAAPPATAATGATWVSEEIVRRQADDCAVEVEERGHQPVLHGESAHTAYNKDGYYVKAAACFVYNQWKKAGGK